MEHHLVQQVHQDVSVHEEHPVVKDMMEKQVNQGIKVYEVQAEKEDLQEILDYQVHQVYQVNLDFLAVVHIVQD